MRMHQDIKTIKPEKYFFLNIRHTYKEMEGGEGIIFCYETTSRHNCADLIVQILSLQMTITIAHLLLANVHIRNHKRFCLLEIVNLIL